MKRGMPPVHPARLLAETMEYLDLKVMPFAKTLGISRQHLHRILKEKAPITPEIAVKIGHIFGNGSRIWLAMQADYDGWQAERRLKGKLKSLPVLHETRV